MSGAVRRGKTSGKTTPSFPLPFAARFLQHLSEEPLNTKHTRTAQFSALTLAALTLAGASRAQSTGGFTPGNIVVYVVDGALNPVTLVFDPVTGVPSLAPNPQYLVPDTLDTPHDTPGNVTVTYHDPAYPTTDPATGLPDTHTLTKTFPPNTNPNNPASTLGNWSHLVRLFEFTPAGANTGKYYNFPIAANGLNHRLTVSGTAGSVGGVSISLNGKYLLSTGIDAAVGGRGPIKPNFAIGRSKSINYPRVVGILDWTNPDPATAFDTTTALTNAFDQENITNVAWTGENADNIYIAGNGQPPTFYDPVKMTGVYTADFTTTGGVVAAKRGATVGTQNYAGGATSVENVYRVLLSGGNLYGSAADAGTSDASNKPQGQHLYGVASIVPGSITALPGFSTDTPTPSAGPKPYDFFFSNSTTLYVADAGSVTGGLQKWLFHSDTGQWGYKVIPTDTFNTPDVTFDNLLLTGLAGTFNAQGQTVIYAIANGTSAKGAPTTVVTLTDTGDASAKFTQIAAPSTTQTFRGLQIIPPTISGRVLLEGATTFSPNAPLGNLTVNYRYVGTTTTVFSQTVPLTADATTAGYADYKLPGVAPGYYDLQIKAAKNLAVALSSVKVGGPFTLPDMTLPAGDANGDNSVDSSDFTALIGAFNSDSTISGSGYDPTADFNYDGSVDSSDFTLLIGQFNNTGAN